MILRCPSSSGDLCYFYHNGSKPPAAALLAIGEDGHEYPLCVKHLHELLKTILGEYKVLDSEGNDITALVAIMAP
jgi:hypothetical protein